MLAWKSASKCLYWRHIMSFFQGKTLWGYSPVFVSDEYERVKIWCHSLSFIFFKGVSGIIIHSSRSRWSPLNFLHRYELSKKRVSLCAGPRFEPRRGTAHWALGYAAPFLSRQHPNLSMPHPYLFTPHPPYQRRTLHSFAHPPCYAAPYIATPHPRLSNATPYPPWLRSTLFK